MLLLLIHEVVIEPSSFLSLGPHDPYAPESINPKETSREEGNSLQALSLRRAGR